MITVSKGDHVWIPPQKPGEFTTSIGAKIINMREGQLELENDDGQRLVIPLSRDIKIIPQKLVAAAPDMIDLAELSESSIIRNLLLRYKDRMIYTYIGSILIAINPYQDLGIYGADYIIKYKGRSLKDLPPHVYAIADVSYREMENFTKPQTLTISGESGSGKTETTKFILKYLTYSSGQHSWIEQQILDSNPVLEAFGNAKTIRNDNSSRFGKYIDIQFDKKGHILSAQILQYLLEKSRIVSQDKGERNYHIFYCMLEGLSNSEKSNLFIEPNTTFKYLRKDSMNVSGRDELAEWNQIMAAFKVVQISEAYVKAIMKILSICLHFGQVDYLETRRGTEDFVEVRDKRAIQNAAKLLEIDPAEVLKALTIKTIKANNNEIATSLNKESANDVRDTFVKSLYGHMFEWIVAEINRTVNKDSTSVQDKLDFGILDIFGFENIGTNSFEQLCINFTNERLQQFFIHHIFKLEQREYESENINWSKIHFVDNQDIIDFIAYSKLNVFALIDEETIFPKGTDLTFVNKLRQTHGKSKFIEKVTGKDQSNFVVHHFAGNITYNCKNFLEKNRDTFSIDFRNVLVKSQNEFVKEIFEKTLQKESQASRRTLASQFKKSMDELMLLMSERHPYFIRCIKPNEKKAPDQFDRELIVRQLRYSGMMETISVRKLGYPIRYSFEFFVSRYYLLLRSRVPISPQSDKVAITRDICHKVLVNEDFQIGKTKVFIKDKANGDLEDARYKVLSEGIVELQTIIRNWACQALFKRNRDIVAVIQSFWRNNSEMRSYTKMRRGFMRLQSLLHSDLVAYRYDMLQKNMVYLQKLCRVYLVTNYNARNMKQIMILQACARTYLELSRINAQLSKESELRDMEEGRVDLERKLTRTMGASRARSEADKKFGNRKEELVERHTALDLFKEDEAVRKVIALNVIRNKKHHLPGEQDLIDRAFQSVFEQNQKDNNDLELELPEYNFNVYARTNFQKGQKLTYSKDEIVNSLLKQENILYELGAIACWIMLLRFMGDIKGKDSKSRMKDQTVMGFLNNNISPKLLCEDSETMDALVVAHTKEFSGRTFKDLIKSEFIPKRFTTPFESMQYIIGMGVLVPQLRNEIYCQIMKQLSGNESVSSFARGWVLLSTVVAFFPCSEDLLKYLKAFIIGGPKVYADYTMYKLSRTLENGQRYQCPSFLEIQAMKFRKPLEITVTSIDGKVVSIYIDPTTIGKDAVGAVCAKLGIEDRDGFGLTVSAFNNRELVFDQDYVLDVVSLCESYGLKSGVSPKNVTLMFVFMKIFFPPWTLTIKDNVALQTIYEQLIKGLRYGEYPCTDISELMSYAVQSYFVDVGTKLAVSSVQNHMRKFVADEDYQTNKSRRDLMEGFQNSFREIAPELKVAYGEGDEGRREAKEKMVESMRYRWPIKFSRHFQNVDLAGPTLSVDNVSLIMTWKAMHLVDNEKILQTFDYPEMINMSQPHDTKRHKEMFTMSTPDHNYIFSMTNVDRLRSTLLSFVEGLKDRSHYALAIEDFEPSARGKGSLQLKKGDIIYIYDKNGQSTDLLVGENDRNGREGEFQRKSVYIIPTADKPTAKAMATLAKLAFKDISQFLQGDTEDTSIFPLWEKFANRNFRLGGRGDAIVGRANARICHQTTMLRHPLLNKLNEEDINPGQHKQFTQQCRSFFKAILKYGELPVKGFKKEECQAIVDSIFQPCLQSDNSVPLLREEVYCQILKQMTLCKDPAILNRMWELMWLITGLFAPRKELGEMLVYFFKSKDTKVGSACLKRIVKMRSGDRRQPPTLIEIDCIQHKALRLFHQTKLPDGTNETVEIDCASKLVDIANRLAKSLRLVTPDEYALLIRTADEGSKKELHNLISVYLFIALFLPDREYFFDFIRRISDEFSKKNLNKAGDDYRFKYELHFIRKLWINIIPGEDIPADIRFHYPQELQKYLTGLYSTVNIDDSVNIAALIYRSRHGQDTSRFSTFIRAISEYVPQRVVSDLSPTEWQQRVEERYLDDDTFSADRSKVEVLKFLYKFPQFGSTFIEAHTTDNRFPRMIILGINKKGISVMDASTKEVLLKEPFSRHTNWSVGENIIHLTLSSKIPPLVCETKKVKRLVDIIESYRNLVDNLEESENESDNEEAAFDSLPFDDDTNVEMRDPFEGNEPSLLYDVPGEEDNDKPTLIPETDLNDKLKLLRDKLGTVQSNASRNNDDQYEEPLFDESSAEDGFNL